MTYFKQFSSNTIGAGANQSFFEMKEGEVRTGLAFFKIAASGKFAYSLLFSDVIDSTYADGSKSRANMTLGGWTIHSLKVGRCRSFPYSEIKKANPDKIPLEGVVTLSFNGKECVKIAEGESCSSDPAMLYFEKGDYIAVEITYLGKKVPHHPESMLPLYNKTEYGYEYSTDMPLPLMIGCDREVKGRIGYLGDSITQGIGAGYNTYLHWCARLADMIGDEYSHYNLGIGYARAADAASDGAWLTRAKGCDVVFLCLGTNDVAHDSGGAKSIFNALKSVICKLKLANCSIILQTAPPFDREGDRKETWFELNRIIKEELSEEVDCVFDNVPYLMLSKEFPEKSKYGGHPNSEGCRIWAEALYDNVNSFLKERLK